MNTINSDFTLLQCREALADFDQAMVEQAVVVVTSDNAELIQKAARDPEMGRVVFWVKEWMAIERIDTKSAALARLRVVPAIRRERLTAGRMLLANLNLALGFGLCIGQTAVFFMA